MLHGREAELRELLGAAAAALADGRGFVALVTGDAGIGKTRLAAEVAARMRADGVPVAWAACRRAGGAPPYWPWVQLLERLGRSAALGTAGSDDPDLARFRLYDAVGAQLRAAAPVLLVLDDLHWADLPSLRLLDALAADVAASPVVVLGTYRDTEPGDAAGIAAERRIVLRGLPASSLGPALAEITGADVPSAVVAALHRRTGGNPFFAAEIVRMLRGEGALDVAAALPTGVRAVLDRRLDRLPEAARHALRAVAVVDAGVTQGCDAALLAAVSGTDPAALATCLAPAVGAGLIIADQGRYRFPHALVADTVLAATAPEEQLDLHRRAAAVLVDRLRTGGDAAGPAHHLLTAARLSGDPEEALAAARAATAAAHVAMDAAAYEDAVGWLERGIALLGDVPGLGPLLCALGEAALAAGEPGRARAAFVRAAEHARRHARPEQLAAAALGVTGGSAGFEVNLSDLARLPLLEEAVAALPVADSALRCAITARLSVALAFTNGEPRRWALADEAVAMARRLDDPRSLATALAAFCDAVAGPEHVAERHEAAAEIVACARVAGDIPRELLGRRLLVVALAEAGRWAEADQEIDAYAALAEPLRRPGWSWYVPLWRGARAMMRGDTAATAAYAAELEARVAGSGSVNAELLMLTQRFVRETQAGRPSTEGLDRFLTLAPEIASGSLCTWALIKATRGEPGAAGLLERFLAVRAARNHDSEWIPEMVQGAQTAVLLGHVPAARQLYDLLLPHAGLFAVEGILAGTWGVVHGHLSSLALLLGEHDTANVHLAAAAILDEAAGAELSMRNRPRRPPPAAFCRDGDVWTVTFGGRTVQLRDAKGLHDIAALLARPGRDLAVHELAGSPVLVSAPLELADRTAIDAYRRRLVELADELADAESAHDPVRAERAAAERDALVAELSAVTGLGGRPRAAASDAERMRKAVGNRVRQALGRIEAVHPGLGRHLRASVRTGTFCRYDPEHPVSWTL